MRINVITTVLCIFVSASYADTTFDVCQDVEVATQPLKWEPVEHVLIRKVGKGIEAYSAIDGELIYSRANPLVMTLHTAFSYHYPVTLTPDAIWLTICQGFAKHTQLNAENLRSKIVDFQGRKRITIRRDDFEKGNPNNDWESAFGQFTRQIGPRLGRNLHTTITESFSTTTAREHVAFQIALMHAVEKYFRYELGSFCGIPRVTLAGTPDDWRALKARAKSLRYYELDWWIDSLLPVLDKFIEASEGKPDTEFWARMYHAEEECGREDIVTGWILRFYPYVISSSNQIKRNPYITRVPNVKKRQGIPLPSFPKGISRVPFVWRFYDMPRSYEMNLICGFVGIRQDSETLSLQPEIGWAVKERTRKKTRRSAGRR